jgi:hypothetical protein
LSKNKHKSADLILKLYDLRREPVMRDARKWMAMEFNPESPQDFVDAMAGSNSAYLRMVTSYWEMAASLVNNGAIDADMFNEANGEHIFLISKFFHFLPELREAMKMPRFLGQLEKVITEIPDSEKLINDTRLRSKRWAAIREEAAQKAQAGS